MQMSAWGWALLLIGAALLVALGGYALTLWRRVWSLQREQAASLAERRERLAGDLRILAGSLLDGQLPLIEGAIRIKVLLDNYDTALSLNPNCTVFHLLYEATAHVPTHTDWKALEKTERKRHEKHFSELELQHKASARTAARWLLDDGLRH